MFYEFFDLTNNGFLIPFCALKLVICGISQGESMGFEV